MRIKRGIAVIVAAGALSIGMAGIAGAAPGDNGEGVGGCIAGTFLGNTTNPRPSGHGVIPSQSPGPFVNTGPNEPPRNDRVRGGTIGDFNEFGEQFELRGRAWFDAACPFLP
jgi:hypothetical protein